MKTITKHPYIGGLDGLRAVAAIAVFMVHFQQFSKTGENIGVIDFERLMINGKVGVCLFFVLSGFLLSVPFWREISNNSFPKIRDYMINRAVRIMPIYYCCLFGIMILNGFQSSHINFDNIVSHVFPAQFERLSGNEFKPAFLDPSRGIPILSISTAYISIFAKIGVKKAQLASILLVPIIYIGYRLFMQYLEGYQNWPIQIPLIPPLGVSVGSVNGQALTYSLFAHLPHFFIGIVAASFYHKSNSLTPQKVVIAEVAFWVSAVSVLLILATPIADTLQLAYGRYNFPFVPVLLGVIVFSTPYTQFAKSLLEWAPIKWLGIISYSLYIFHWPIQQACVQTLKALGMSASENVLIFAVMSFVITVMFSHFSYIIIEAPILKRFKKHKQASKNQALLENS